MILRGYKLFSLIILFLEIGLVSLSYPNHSDARTLEQAYVELKERADHLVRSNPTASIESLFQQLGVLARSTETSLLGLFSIEATNTRVHPRQLNAFLRALEQDAEILDSSEPHFRVRILVTSFLVTHFFRRLHRGLYTEVVFLPLWDTLKKLTQRSRELQSERYTVFSNERDYINTEAPLYFQDWSFLGDIFFQYLGVPLRNGSEGFVFLSEHIPVVLAEILSEGGSFLRLLEWLNEKQKGSIPWSVEAVHRFVALEGRSFLSLLEGGWIRFSSEAATNKIVHFYESGIERNLGSYWSDQAFDMILRMNSLVNDINLTASSLVGYERLVRQLESSEMIPSPIGNQQRQRQWVDLLLDRASRPGTLMTHVDILRYTGFLLGRVGWPATPFGYLSDYQERFVSLIETQMNRLLDYFETQEVFNEAEAQELLPLLLANTSRDEDETQVNRKISLLDRILRAKPALLVELLLEKMDWSTSDSSWYLRSAQNRSQIRTSQRITQQFIHILERNLNDLANASRSHDESERTNARNRIDDIYNALERLRVRHRTRINPERDGPFMQLSHTLRAQALRILENRDSSSRPESASESGIVLQQALPDNSSSYDDVLTWVRAVLGSNEMAFWQDSESVLANDLEHRVQHMTQRESVALVLLLQGLPHRLNYPSQFYRSLANLPVTEPDFPTALEMILRSALGQAPGTQGQDGSSRRFFEPYIHAYAGSPELNYDGHRQKRIDRAIDPSGRRIVIGFPVIDYWNRGTEPITDTTNEEDREFRLAAHVGLLLIQCLEKIQQGFSEEPVTASTHQPGAYRVGEDSSRSTELVLLTPYRERARQMTQLVLSLILENQQNLMIPGLAVRILFSGGRLIQMLATWMNATGLVDFLGHHQVGPALVYTIEGGSLFSQRSDPGLDLYRTIFRALIEGWDHGHKVPQGIDIQVIRTNLGLIVKALARSGAFYSTGQRAQKIRWWSFSHILRLPPGRVRTAALRAIAPVFNDQIKDVLNSELCGSELVLSQ